jgi:hypothetical protein
MRETRPPLLALVVAVLVMAPAVAGATTPGPAVAGVAPAGPAVAGATTGPAAVPDEPALGAEVFPVIRAQSNTTNYLDIRGRDVRQGRYAEASLDGSTTVGSAVTRLRGDYAIRSFEVAYANATTAEARTALIRAEVNRLAARIDSLESRQRDALADYNDGELSARRFVAELAAVDAGAESVESQFDRIVERAGVFMPSPLQTRINDNRADLVPLRGPVRERVAAAMAGDRPATDVYTLTSPTGVVLTTIDGERFYREAYLAANRDPDGADNFVTADDSTGLIPAIDRASELYPWVYSRTSPGISRQGASSVYTISVDHSQGRLVSNIDGATRNAFYEVQTLQTNRVPTNTFENETETLAVRVETAFGTGPMEVVVTDPVTQEPLNATVLVGEYRVDTTGADGSLWTTAPHRARVVTVRTEEGVVSVEVPTR